MRVLVNKAITLSVLPGSEVEITERQYQAIRAFCSPVAAASAKEETAETTAKKTTRKRTTKKKTTETTEETAATE